MSDFTTEQYYESAAEQLCGDNHDPSLKQFAVKCLKYETRWKDAAIASAEEIGRLCQKQAEARSIIEQAVNAWASDDRADMDWFDRARKWLKGKHE